MNDVGPKVRGVAALAARQEGVVTRAQLRALGFTRDQVLSWVRRGRLHQRFRGVYAVGRADLSLGGEWLAAVWACGEGAVLSHRSAAALHGMVAEVSGDVHVSTTRDLGSRSGLIVHRTRHLDAADVVALGLLPVTRQPRTLLDLADVLPYAELRGIADALRRLDLEALHAAQDRAPNRRGAARVARLLASEGRRTRSAFERRYLRFCTAQGLPRPDATNVRVAGHEVDALYAGARLAVELDGRAHHERRAQMRADRRRDADLQLAGLRVLRLVWEQLDADEASRTAGLVQGLLAVSP
jgi:very-short-patch-repair endonuclease